MSTRSRASQWFGPRPASAPLQYKAPAQEPIEWEIGPWHTIPGFDTGGTNFLPKFASRIERYDLTSNYEESPMSDFKVGDVVRVKKGTGTTSTVEKVDGELVWIRGDQFGAWRSAHLELVSRPSDPLATIKPTPYAARGMPSICDKALKPMTAMAASILGNNQTDPMRDLEYTHEIDVMRYVGLFGNQEKYLHEKLLGRYQRMGPPIGDGWMPAGTYMPMQRALPRMMSLRKPTLPPQSVRLSGDGFGSGIEAKGIKKTNRLICNQTRSWDPEDDTFLEDA